MRSRRCGSPLQGDMAICYSIILSSGHYFQGVGRQSRTMVLVKPARSSYHVALDALEPRHGKVEAQFSSMERLNLGSESDMHVGLVVGIEPCATWWRPVFISPPPQFHLHCGTEHYQRDNSVGGCWCRCRCRATSAPRETRPSSQRWVGRRLGDIGIGTLGRSVLPVGTSYRPGTPLKI